MLLLIDSNFVIPWTYLPKPQMLAKLSVLILPSFGINKERDTCLILMLLIYNKENGVFPIHDWNCNWLLQETPDGVTRWLTRDGSTPQPCRCTYGTEAGKHCHQNTAKSLRTAYIDWLLNIHYMKAHVTILRLQWLQWKHTNVSFNSSAVVCCYTEGLLYYPYHTPIGDTIGKFPPNKSLSPMS